MDRSGDFYFLEMNTRLQVEHTVTEMVTGIDLAKEQLRIAMGESLSFDSVESRGHAIEFRINAEDPARDFMPHPGEVVEYREPGGPGVRVDSGVRAGSAISQYYDNLIAKLVVWGRDRTEAIERSRRALGEFTITGVATTIPFHCHALGAGPFVDAEHHTRTVEENMDLSELKQPAAPVLPEEEAMAQRTMTVEVGGKRFAVKLWAPEIPTAPAAGGSRPGPRRRPPKLSQAPAAVSDEGVIAAPMQGTIVKVHHRAGEHVDADGPLFVLEAMKMENEIRSPAEGEIIDMRVEAGDKVSAGQVLAIVR
jgi:acetyl-CoA/propionyl-CoA carboxylase biotin carboxyl carrier protein